MQKKYLKLQRVKGKTVMLNVTNLNVGYGSFQALFNIDIDVKNKSHLSKVIASLRSSDFIESVSRV